MEGADDRMAEGRATDCHNRVRGHFTALLPAADPSALYPTETRVTRACDADDDANLIDDAGNSRWAPSLLGFLLEVLGHGLGREVLPPHIVRADKPHQGRILFEPLQQGKGWGARRLNSKCPSTQKQSAGLKVAILQNDSRAAAVDAPGPTVSVCACTAAQGMHTCPVGGQGVEVGGLGAPSRQQAGAPRRSAACQQPAPCPAVPAKRRCQLARPATCPGCLHAGRGLWAHRQAC